MNGSKLRRLAVGAAMAGLLVPGPVAAEPARWTEPLAGIELVEMPAGCFVLGSNTVGWVDEHQELLPHPPFEDERPAHEACVGPFWIGRIEVTQAQWLRAFGGDPQRIDGTLPQSRITLAEVDALLRSLNRNGIGPNGEPGRFRLPTEAEWEYACRAGAREPVPWVSIEEAVRRVSTLAWYGEALGADPQPGPAGSMLPNDWGLHDMLGNVWEITADGYDEDGYARHVLHDPHVEPGDDGRRVIRGAGYRSTPTRVRCGTRAYILPDDPLPEIGVRVVWSRSGEGAQ